MIVRTIFLALAIALLPGFALAGGDHSNGHSHSHGPIDAPAAKKSARKNVSRLIDKGKVPASWKKIEASSAEKKMFGKKEEWVVVFRNDKVEDPAKQTLYIFLGLDGTYIAANYTGN